MRGNGDLVQGSLDLQEQCERPDLSANRDEEGINVPTASDQNGSSEQNTNGNGNVLPIPNATNSHDPSTEANGNTANPEAQDAPELEIDSQVSSVGQLSDTDSAMGMSTMSSTVSLRESVMQYVEENGRTYHAYNSGSVFAPLRGL
ncbi:hypothetical protein CJF32_00004446 [Rutstroemia sp. NJR-2017a WRK4]|nr:hypothetical protein CJF32_00004446 [Rutstroemia sp. NJR-2017a WRK4]